MKIKTLLSWSSGKDSAWALYQLQQDPHIEVVGLFSTINQQNGKVGSHGVHKALLQQQAKSAGLPLHCIELAYPSKNTTYQNALLNFAEQAKQQGIRAFAFGDLFLEDIRSYREQLFAPTGIQTLYPLWGIPTADLAQSMIQGGLKALTTCISRQHLDTHFVGCEFEQSFLEALPAGVDPCGENGEFHSFAYAGPMFTNTIKLHRGEIKEQAAFSFIDIQLSEPPAT